ncbi:hypothetical protein WA158_008341 [Blastocystis sp. Blastoise]
MGIIVSKLVSKVLYLPPKAGYPSYHSRFKDSYFEILTPDGKIAAVFINRNLPLTFIYMHGNAEDLFSTYFYLHWLSYTFGVNVISFDYPGYGQTSGECTEPQLKRCAERLINHVLTVIKLDPKNIVLYGHSLGTAIASHLAYYLTNKGIPPAGLILQSAFTSVYSIGIDFRTKRKSDMYRTIDIIGYIECPILFIHGNQDNLIPRKHTQRLYMAVQQKYRNDILFVDNAGHNNVETRCYPRIILLNHIRQFMIRVRQQELYNEYYIQPEYDSTYFFDLKNENTRQEVSDSRENLIDFDRYDDSWMSFSRRTMNINKQEKELKESLLPSQ